MSSSVFSSLFSALDSRAIGDFASQLGAPEQAVSKAWETSNATLLGALANKTGDSGWMNRIFDLVSGSPASVNVSDVASAAMDPSRASPATASLLDAGKNFLGLAFGGMQSSIFEAVAKFCGLQPGAISRLMGMAAPLMMSALGRLVRDDRMSPAGLGRVLASEGESARGLIPPGVSALLGGAAPMTRPTVSETPPPPLSVKEFREPARRSRAWWWIIPLAILGLLIYWGYRGRHPVGSPVTVVRPTVAPSIPGTTTLVFPRDPGAGRLLAFIQDPNRSVDQGTRFDFDRLLFATNSAAPGPGSEGQITDIVAILNAYPNTRLRIEGHADSSGGAAQNMRLAQDRANSVRSALVAKGVSPDRLEARGYGSQSPAADNSTASGRAMNRRASVIVLQK